MIWGLSNNTNICLKVDELWIFVASKANKRRLIYANCHESGGVVEFVWGDKSVRTTKRLRKKLISSDIHNTRKKHIVGIESDNCDLRHCRRRIFRRFCSFSKKILRYSLNLPDKALLQRKPAEYIEKFEKDHGVSEDEKN